MLHKLADLIFISPTRGRFRCCLQEVEVKPGIGHYECECGGMCIIRPGLPGTQLHELLRRFGFRERADCKCKYYADRMDRYGVDWCELNEDTIVGWLKEAARKRKLPFANFIAKRFIRAACKQARKIEAAAYAEDVAS